MSHDIAYHDEANTFSVLIGSKQNANPGQFKAEQPAPWEYRAKLVIKEYPKSIDEFLKVFVASEERCPHIKSKGLFQSSNGFKGQGDDFAQQLVEGLNAMSFELPEAKGLDFVNTVGETIVFRDEDNVTQGPASSPAIVASYPGIRFQGGRVPKWHQISIALQVRLRKDEDPVGRYANRDEETLFELLQTARNILVTGRTLFAFVVGIYGNTARIFRVDRTGVVVSQSFNYIVRPNLFREFLWRFTHPTVGGMFVGADPSVSLPTEQDLHWARQILHKQNMTDVYLEASRWVAIEMPDKSRKKFLTAKPASISLDLFARGTNVCLVIQQSSTNGKLQVLKESWCDTKHEPEIKFYEEIRVRNPGKLFGVADFICGQDLGKAETDRLVALGTASGTLPAAASTQNAAPRLTIRLPAARIARTRMQTRSSKNDCPPPPVAPGHNTVAHWDHRKHAADHANRRSHMRLLYNTIGRELTNITSTRELAEGIRDAIKGHRTVFEAGVLHRDISEGNVMIADGEEFKGFIHDFDMAMLRENEPDRSGAIYVSFVTYAPTFADVCL
ncbi:predicted protein [Postia placenta Mad-698-R]|uniref:Fungal-type protein kinase domain-containing protein n=1 Tax=Postia placenta MAD-698-R-SB12 TaxID=670580 RepID=A0A1X6MPD6_9APHY|nr:hypothetical protein POSPLADRAFT_1049500 [Postia placenta MAD-698-R-SB12]EED84140.1 predicted protein [Postia placenta Mad-698-R]OSX58274.1 hypothetical protein POSPLADRAFT_1049500 [Postia placenta MAD-698-R-SB12]